MERIPEMELSIIQLKIAHSICGLRIRFRI
nr:MAG TPA: hypothetical protein [Caudoviricetes sp.]